MATNCFPKIELSFRAIIFQICSYCYSSTVEIINSQSYSTSCTGKGKISSTDATAVPVIVGVVVAVCFATVVLALIVAAIICCRIKVVKKYNVQIPSRISGELSLCSFLHCIAMYKLYHWQCMCSSVISQQLLVNLNHPTKSECISLQYYVCDNGDSNSAELGFHSSGPCSHSTWQPKQRHSFHLCTDGVLHTQCKEV